MSWNIARKGRKCGCRGHCRPMLELEFSTRVLSYHLSLSLPQNWARIGPALKGSGLNFEMSGQPHDSDWELWDEVWLDQDQIPIYDVTDQKSRLSHHDWFYSLTYASSSVKQKSLGFKILTEFDKRRIVSRQKWASTSSPSHTKIKDQIFFPKLASVWPCFVLSTVTDPRLALWPYRNLSVDSVSHGY